MLRRRLLAGAAVVAVWGGAPLGAAPSATDEIVARAGAYVAGFVQRFSSVVAEERFTQNAQQLPGRPGPRSGDRSTSKTRELVAQGMMLHRELVSDYLLVKVQGSEEWQTFRDVVEVDGRPVPERNERLTQLFLEPAATTLARAREIVDDGARFNLGDSSRTLANPLLALGLLQPHYHSRFKYSLRENDPEGGPGMWVVEYREQARPTLMRRVPDGDLPARGRFWIERQTGRVVRTELTVSEEDVITTSFTYDERFQIALPVEMRESYWFGSAYVTGVASYGRFRQFGVQTEESVNLEGKK